MSTVTPGRLHSIGPVVYVTRLPDTFTVTVRLNWPAPPGRVTLAVVPASEVATGTPTLNVCGALDRCTPPEEAVQFHSALLENGVKSVLVTYPEEGHGVRESTNG